MSKLDDLAVGRREGMAYALRIAEKDGLDGLKEEIEKRKITGLDLNVSHKEMEEATQQMRNMMMDTIMSFSMGILHDEFGFGHDRLQRFMDRFEAGAELLNSGAITWQQIIENTQETTGINLKIRRNDTNTTIKRRY